MNDDSSDNLCHNLCHILSEPAKENEDIFIGIGGNLVLPNHISLATSIKSCLDILMNANITPICHSQLYNSAPIPKSSQPNFNNMVIKINTAYSPLKLLGCLHGIEAAMGRIRNIRNEARVIDLDLLVFGNRISDDVNCLLPHPRMSERAFVLLPLAEIAPKWCHPITQKHINTLVAELPPGQEIQLIN